MAHDKTDYWTTLVTDAIKRFNDDTAPRTGYINQTVPVALYKDTDSLILLHVLAMNCPVERRDQFKQMLKENVNDKDHSYILERLNASIMKGESLD